MSHWTDKVPETPIRFDPQEPSVIRSHFERLVIPYRDLAQSADGLRLMLNGDFLRIRSELPVFLTVDSVEVSAQPMEVLPLGFIAAGSEPDTGFDILYKRPFREIRLRVGSTANQRLPFQVQSMYGQVDVWWARGGVEVLGPPTPFSMGQVYNGTRAAPADTFIHIGPVHPTVGGDNAVVYGGVRKWIPSRLRIVGITGTYVATAAGVPSVLTVAFRSNDGVFDSILRTWIGRQNYGAPLDVGSVDGFGFPIHVPNFAGLDSTGLGGLMFLVTNTAADVTDISLGVSYEAEF